MVRKSDGGIAAGEGQRVNGGADQLAFMKEKAAQFGFEVLEKSDGTVQMKRSTKK